MSSDKKAKQDNKRNSRGSKDEVSQIMTGCSKMVKLILRQKDKHPAAMAPILRLKKNLGSASMSKLQRKVCQFEIKTQWLERPVKENEDRVDWMTASKTEIPARTIEPGEKSCLVPVILEILGQMTKSLLMPRFRTRS
jgi:hypothetical protein